MQTRRAPRYAVDHPVTATRYWEDIRFRRVQGRCRVIGLGGAAATIADQLYIGEVVSLEITPALKVYASVRNVRRGQYGLQFLFLSDDERQAIARLCEACAAKNAN